MSSPLDTRKHCFSSFTNHWYFTMSANVNIWKKTTCSLITKKSFGLIHHLPTPPKIHEPQSENCWSRSSHRWMNGTGVAEALEQSLHTCQSSTKQCVQLEHIQTVTWGRNWTGHEKAINFYCLSHSLLSLFTEVSFSGYRNWYFEVGCYCGKN